MNRIQSKLQPALQTGAGIAQWLPVILLLLMSVSMLMAVFTQLPGYFSTRRQIETQTVAAAKLEHKVNGLKEAREYARTEQFTEYWARVTQRWGRPNEHSVVLLGSTQTNDQRDKNWLDDFVAE